MTTGATGRKSGGTGCYHATVQIGAVTGRTARDEVPAVSAVKNGWIVFRGQPSVRMTDTAVGSVVACKTADPGNSAVEVDAVALAAKIRLSYCWNSCGSAYQGGK